MICLVIYWMNKNKGSILVFFNRSESATFLNDLLQSKAMYTQFEQECYQVRRDRTPAVLGRPRAVLGRGLLSNSSRSLSPSESEPPPSEDEESDWSSVRES